MTSTRNLASSASTGAVFLDEGDRVVAGFCFSCASPSSVKDKREQAAIAAMMYLRPIISRNTPWQKSKGYRSKGQAARRRKALQFAVTSSVFRFVRLC